MLQAVHDWLTELGYHGEIKDDPSMDNPNRQVLYMHQGLHLSWKIYNDSPTAIYLGTSYMSRWVVKEINLVTQKVGELYEYYSSS